MGRVAPTRKGFVLDGFEHDGTLVVVGMTKSEGSPACGSTNIRATSLYSVGEDPDHDAVMRIAAKAPRRRDPFCTTASKPWFSPGHHHLEPSSATRRNMRDCAETVRCSLSASSLQCAGRRTTPSGTTPSRTRCHKAIRSLRAKATIIFLREVRAFLVRISNHFAKALSFWNLRKRHASWTIPFRTRALPDRESPFSRLLLPLSSGEPVSPP